MSTDNEVSTDKVLISFKKAKPSALGESKKGSKIGLKPSKTVTSNDESLSGTDYSDVSFFLQEEGNPNQLAKVIVTKGRGSRTKKEDIHQTSPSEMKSDHFLKEEIVSSILDEIINKVGGPRKVSSVSSYTYLKDVSSQMSKPFKHDPGFVNGPQMKTGLHISNRNKEKNRDKKKRELAAVVKELELPVSLSDKPHIESHPKFERLVLDTHITTSATIIAKPDVNKVHGSLSDTSQPGQQTVDASTGTNEEKTIIRSPFELCWCFGYNTEVPVINLSDDESSKIVFANSQYAVIYDFHEDTMAFMQGHLNTVSCMASTPAGNLIVTADSGRDVGGSRVIVWDRIPCVLQVLDNVHPHGCQQVGLSSTGDFLVTVSANETPTCIKVWDWEKDYTNPSASITVKESLGNVKKLTTHASSNRDFAVTFERSVLFARVEWQTVLHDGSSEGRISDRIKDCEFGISSSAPPKLGGLTDTTFLEGTEAIALSSTCKGYVVVWEGGLHSKHKKTYRKYVRLHLDCITNIQTVDNKVAVATVSGNVSFYDFELKILYFHKLNREPLVSLSFNLTTQQQNEAICEEHPSCANTWKNEPRKLVDASLKNEPFSVRHFVVSTESGRLAYVNASCGTPKYLSFPNKEVFTALDMMPNSKLLCAGTASGKCILFDTDRRKVKVTQQLKVQANLCQAISFLKYSPSGYILACGMYTGEIWLLNPLLYPPVLDTPLTGCNYCITQMVFSSDSEYLIVVDVSFCISGYFVGETPTLLGQYIAHYKPIVSLVVEPTDVEDRIITVYTVSADRSICQFVIDKEKKSFDFILNQRVEQSAVPSYSVYYPQPYSSSGTFLGVNLDCKFRLHDSPNTFSSRNILSRRCRGRIQAPNFGSPINYMAFFENNGELYLFFKTQRQLGVHLLPIDGNPFRALGFRASPTDIICCAIHPNGQYVFTISEFCCGISMWEINTEPVKDFLESGGEGLEPFLKTLGKEKEHEIREFFYLGQVIHQGESPHVVRTLKNYLPICEVPNVLQALGCHLSKQEIGELNNEVITSDPDNPNYSIDYDEFVRLYCNVRSTFDLNIEDLRQAFRDFHVGVYYASHSIEGLQMAVADPVFDAASFIQKLLVTGEEMTMEELYADFAILTGGQVEPRDEEGFMCEIPPTMPKEVSFETFVRDILGFSVSSSHFD